MTDLLRLADWAAAVDVPSGLVEWNTAMGKFRSAGAGPVLVVEEGLDH